MRRAAPASEQSAVDFDLGVTIAGNDMAVVRSMLDSI
jgi:hypothetical protein